MEQESLVDQKLVRSLQLEIAKLQVDLNSKKDELEEAISTQVSKKFRLFVLCVLQRYVSSVELPQLDSQSEILD